MTNPENEYATALFNISLDDEQTMDVTFDSDDSLNVEFDTQDATARFDISFDASEQTMDVSFATDDSFSLDFGQIQIIHDGATESYNGPYVVTPSFAVQTLATTDKYMEDDVTVLEIPMTEVSNLSGGLTLNIGEEKNA